MKITYKRIDSAHQANLQLKNEPFELFGRLNVSFTNGKWGANEELFSTTSTQTFPDEFYDFEDFSQTGIAFGAYAGKRCIGVAIFNDSQFQYAYLEDLKILTGYRRHGIANQLLRFALDYIKDDAFSGIVAVCQDNNLGACRFYLKSGFTIGGLNTHVYTNTSQAGKNDIYFYLDR